MRKRERHSKFTMNWEIFTTIWLLARLLTLNRPLLFSHWLSFLLLYVFNIILRCSNCCLNGWKYKYFFRFVDFSYSFVHLHNVITKKKMQKFRASKVCQMSLSILITHTESLSVETERIIFPFTWSCRSVGRSVGRAVQAARLLSCCYYCYCCCCCFCMTRYHVSMCMCMRLRCVLLFLYVIFVPIGTKKTERLQSSDGLRRGNTSLIKIHLKYRSQVISITKLIEK